MDKTINQDIKYIGCDDKEITLFEGQYILEDGMCYNSYIIEDEKIAVMDTVDKAKKDEWLSNLEKALNGRVPDYLIVQHVEPDHSSVLGEVAEKYPSLTVVCSAAAQKMLPLYFPNLSVKIQTVKEGDEIKLGKNTLKFFAAPMVHWPEVIVTYAVEAKVLFSADGFGKFGVYDSEPDDWACEARRYYFNICGKYGVQVQNLMKKAATLEIETICPLHGPILKGEGLKEALRLYDIWSKYDVETEGVFIAYCTMHSNTGNAAEYLADVLRKNGVKVSASNICVDDWAEGVEDAFKYSTLVLAAPTYDGGLFPKMADFIHHLKIKNYQKRKIAFIENGSWAPQAAKHMKEMVKDFKDVTIIEEQVTLKGALKDEDKKKLEELAEKLK
jgi:flavorubredoxin